MRAFSIILASACLASLAACTAAQPPSPTPSASSPEPVPKTLWTTSEKVVGTPVVVDETVVAYTHGSHGLEVVAWNLADGRRLWSERAEPGGEEPTVVPDVAAISGHGGYVAFLAPTGVKYWQRAVVVHAATGKRVEYDPDWVWSESAVESCASKTTFCLRGYLDGDAKEASLRLNVKTGHLKHHRSDAPPDGASFLDGDIFATDARRPKGIERLGLWGKGKARWTRPYESVFGRGFSSDGGWAWVDVGTDQLVGSGVKYQGQREKLTRTGAATADLSRVVTVGLRQSDGKTLWRLDHVMACFFIGLNERAVPGRVPLCRIHAGTLHWKRVGEGRYIDWGTGFQIDLLSVDGRTGEVLWSVPIGGEGYEHDPSVFVSSAAASITPINGRAVRIDNATGSVTPVADGDVLACQLSRAAVSVRANGKKRTLDAGYALRPCDASASTVASWNAVAVRQAATDAGAGRWVLGVPDGLLVVQL